ncbi:hypothetical protein C0992_012502, partial [Termitomyces sp. T32_za158]
MENTQPPSIPAQAAILTTTWASRNPGLDIQPTRVRLMKNKSDAAHATQKLQAQNKKENQAKLESKIDLFLEDQKRFIEETAKRFAVQESLIQQQITHATTYTKHHKVSLRNALIHHKHVELNE